MFVKICGLQTPDTVNAAVQAGADALGFVFVPSSVRFVTAPHAAELVRTVPEQVETVGVFRNQNISEILETASVSGITTVQLHGAETIEDVMAIEAAGYGVLRAFDIETYRTLTKEEQEFYSSRRLLIDAVEPGSGETFEGELLEGFTPQGWWLLAGGLTSDNVVTLIAQFNPNGVDISSGVESERGVKDRYKIEKFIHNVRATRRLK